MGEKLLFYVDDDTDDLATFLYAARKIAIEVRLFNQCEYIMRSLQQEVQMPFAIFVDLNMRGIDGFECIRQIAQEKKLESIPVVAFSTASDRHSVQKAKDAGATCYISKPKSISQLNNTLQYIISNNWKTFVRESDFHIKKSDLF